MQKNVAGQYVSLRAFNSSAGAPVTGDAANITFYVQKDNGSVTAIAAAVTEVSAANMPGVYKALLTQADTNGDCVLICGKSSTSNVVIADKEYATTPANFATTVIDSTGSVSIRSGYKRNVAAPNFSFVMTDGLNSNPAPGRTVTVTRSIDTAAHAAGTISAVREIGNGQYAVDLPAADMNGSEITLRCTAPAIGGATGGTANGTACNDLLISIRTDPL